MQYLQSGLKKRKNNQQQEENKQANSASKDATL
jgi:hypothetical protein